MNENIPDATNSNDPEKGNPTNQQYLETNISTNDEGLKAVISHLSMEAQLLISNAHSFRTRSAYTIWLGPYIILGAIIASADSSFPAINLSSKSISWLIYSASSYWFLGLIAGFIERNYWIKIRGIQEAIIELSVEKNNQDYFKKKTTTLKIEKILVYQFGIQ